MKARTITLIVLLWLVAASICFASSAQMGTWKLNEAKSKAPAGSPRNNMVMYEASGDNIKVTVDGVDSAGKPTHSEWVGKFDGKDYPVTGDPTSDMRSYKTINDHSMELTAKKDGKVTMSGKIVVSADGKSRTVTVNATDAEGKKITMVGVYDKQ
jgi:hypothetical protein